MKGACKEKFLENNNSSDMPVHETGAWPCLVYEGLAHWCQAVGPGCKFWCVTLQTCALSYHNILPPFHD